MGSSVNLMNPHKDLRSTSLPWSVPIAALLPDTRASAALALYASGIDSVNDSDCESYFILSASDAKATYLTREPGVISPEKSPSSVLAPVSRPKRCKVFLVSITTSLSEASQGAATSCPTSKRATKLAAPMSSMASSAGRISHAANTMAAMENMKNNFFMAAIRKLCNTISRNGPYKSIRHPCRYSRECSPPGL